MIKALAQLFRYLKPYLHIFFFALFCMLVYSISNGVVAYISGPATSVLFKSDSITLPLIFNYKLPIEIDPKTAYLFVPILIICAFFIKGISYFGQSYLMDYLSEKCIRDLRNHLYFHIQRLSLQFFTDTTTGNIISRIITDLNLVKKLLSGLFLQAAGDVITILILVILAFNLDWKLAIIASFVFPVAVIPIIQFGKRMRKVSHRAQNVFGRIISTIHEAVSGIRIVKGFGMESHEYEKFSVESHNLFRAMTKISKITSTIVPLMEFIGAIGLAGVIFYAGLRINKGDLQPANLVSFFVAVMLMYQPLKRLSNFNNNLQQGLTGLERINEIFAQTPEIAFPEKGREIRWFSDSIVFENINFKYASKEILKNINFKVKAGEKVAFVGITGVGKTTLMSLLPRFYEITDGRILIDGVDIREIKLSALRSLIAIVTQQVVLFNDTIKNNILYGSFSRSEEDVIRAAKLANAHDFITKLPKGYDTVIGESGVRLSGGERQKIAIARAILRDAPILILDEATSSLDSVAEKEIQSAIDNLMQGKTTFIIAHRLSTVQKADRIYVLSEGTIKEVGKHDELLALRGTYYKLYTTQFQFSSGAHSL